MLSVLNPLDWATVFRLMLSAELKVLIGGKNCSGAVSFPVRVLCYYVILLMAFQIVDFLIYFLIRFCKFIKVRLLS